MRTVVFSALLVISLIPLAGAGVAAYGFVQERSEMERRVSALEIHSGAADERVSAMVARIDAIDRTLWRLIAVLFGTTAVSGVVAGDRVIYRVRTARTRAGNNREP